MKEKDNARKATKVREMMRRRILELLVWWLRGLVVMGEGNSEGRGMRERGKDERWKRREVCIRK